MILYHFIFLICLLTRCQELLEKTQKNQRKIYLINSIENAQYLDFILLDYERQEHFLKTQMKTEMQRQISNAKRMDSRPDHDESQWTTYKQITQSYIVEDLPGKMWLTDCISDEKQHQEYLGDAGRKQQDNLKEDVTQDSEACAESPTAIFDPDVQQEAHFFKGEWHLSLPGDETMVADAETVNLAQGLFNKNYGDVQVKFTRNTADVDHELGLELVILQGEYQDQMIRLAFDLPTPPLQALTDKGDLIFTSSNIKNAVFETYSNMYRREQRNCSLSLEFTSREEELLNFRKANMLYLLVKSAGEDSCVPDDSEIVVFSQEMTRQHKRTVIAQIYKFETISSAIFAVTLISCHLELARTKQSFFDRQRSNRDYSSRLSILRADSN